MFDHVKFGVRNYAASRAFFLKALEPLGVTVATEWPPSGVELSQPQGKVSLCLYQTEETPAHLHLAFTAKTRQQVEAFYRAALEAGGRDNGALCVFSLHSQNFGDGQPLNAALPAYLSYVQSQKNTVWLASPQAIDTWWRDRERLQIIVRPVGPRIEFDVTVGGKQPVKGGSLVIVLPKKGLLPVISGLKINMPTPKVTLLDDFRASIVFESLSPGNYFFQAVF